MYATEVLAVVLIAVNAWAYVELAGHLETKHRPLWDQLGQPAVYNDYRNLFQPTLRFWGFIYLGNFWKSSDRRVKLLGVAFLASNLALIVVMVVYLAQ